MTKTSSKFFYNTVQSSCYFYLKQQYPEENYFNWRGGPQPFTTNII